MAVWFYLNNMITTTTLLTDVFGDPGDTSPLGQTYALITDSTLSNNLTGQFSPGLSQTEMLYEQTASNGSGNFDAVTNATAANTTWSLGSDNTFTPRLSIGEVTTAGDPTNASVEITVFSQYWG